MIILMVVLVIAMCFSLFNYWFQSDKYKRLTDNEKKQQNILNSPTAWMTFFVISLLTTFALISYLIYNFFVAAFKLG